MTAARPPLALGFDADDTLWHNETLFAAAHDKFFALLAAQHDAPTVERTLFATEMRNLPLYGYGAKGFTLSALETAITLTAGRISATELSAILELGREILAHPVELLEGVPAVLTGLAAAGHPLLLITKGDLLHQERKIAASGLAQHFLAIEVVSEKDDATYARLLRRHGLAADRFLMIGNSLKSDIAPLLRLGACAAHIPYPLTWAHEHLDSLPPAEGRFFTLKNLRDLPALVARLST
ncbi:haloacid dehalogenase [Verrucomicrobia bacterium IMCC26134]|jgi:putative hydrolase of the HAD superfamily|nr:haloacid dehalogenase [Verrucomicrobia bacterium IMCC26134]